MGRRYPQVQPCRNGRVYAEMKVLARAYLLKNSIKKERFYFRKTALYESFIIVLTKQIQHILFCQLLHKTTIIRNNFLHQ